MIHRLRERRSSLAIWSSRLAVLSVPVLVIAAIGRRSELLSVAATYGAIALGFGIAALAVIAAIAAFEAIWRDGRKGGGPALSGLLIGLAVLSLPAVGAWKVLTYPELTDISTDTDDPPAFLQVLAARGPDARPLNPPSDDEIELQHEAYPDIVPRHYAVEPGRVFDAALAIVRDRGWPILDQRPPEGTNDAWNIETVASTPIFGFRQDVAVRIAADGDGSLVDMRSAARNGAHDLGANAARIRDFFTDLDAALQGTGG
jgi:uncharacterized protein (DUF1499 family)